MKKTYIICKSNLNGNTVFECAHCGRHISHYQLVKNLNCQRCDRKFKNKIVIKRSWF